MEECTPTASVKKKKVKKKVLKKRVKPEKGDDNGENGEALLVEAKVKRDEAAGSRRGSYSQEKTVSKVPDNQLSKHKNFGMFKVTLKMQGTNKRHLQIEYKSGIFISDILKTCKVYKTF